MNDYLSVMNKYAEFNGRARRREYWMFALVNFCICMPLALLSGWMSIFYIPYVLYSLAIFIPSLAVTVRRLHDTDKSGWWVLVGLVPLIGGIALLVFTVLDGTSGSNSYGEDPKAFQY